jgi:hypothetical protein
MLHIEHEKNTEEKNGYVVFNKMSTNQLGSGGGGGYSVSSYPLIICRPPVLREHSIEGVRFRDKPSQLIYRLYLS